MHGTRTANYAMDEADLISRSAPGSMTGSPASCRSSRRARSSSTSTSTRPRSPRTCRRTSRSSATPKNILPRLTAEYRALEPQLGRLEEWWIRIRSWQERYPLRYEDSDDAEIKPQYMIQALYEATGGDAIVTRDVGQHQMWTAQYFHFARPRRWINSGGLGTMGFGLPAAMGAKVGCPDETVVCIAGDGSVQMNMQELATCAQEGIAIKVFIMNNGYLGMVRQWQELFWDKRYSAVGMGQ